MITETERTELESSLVYLRWFIAVYPNDPQVDGAKRELHETEIALGYRPEVRVIGGGGRDVVTKPVPEN